MRKQIALALALSTCAMLVGPARADPVGITYWLWDGNQLPPYQKCADDFNTANPTIHVTVTQVGWGDYWTGLGTAFISGDAPDVFTDHLAKYAEFVSNGQLLDLTDRIAADHVNMSQYIPGLAAAWSKDGHQYGLPKDWDTIAFFYNKQMVADAGITDDQLKSMTWNPKDGGTFDKIIAKLTIDANGKRGDEPGFDKSHIKIFGFAGGNNADAYGQGDWSFFAASDGFKFIDQPWGKHYNYDSPALLETLIYLRDLAFVKGYIPTPQQSGSAGPAALFSAGKVAMVPDGDWMIGSYVANSPFKLGLAPIVEGPDGRKSMLNGLADSIWSGTKHPDEAWQWVKYLGTAACQDVVGKAGVVFPAIQSGVDLSVAKRAAAGLDVTPYTMVAKPETTFPYPISDFGGQISSIMTSAIGKVFLNEPDPGKILKDANDEVNGLFQ